MAITMTEAELLKAGFVVNPETNQAVPVAADAQPDETWQFDRLMSYGFNAVTESGRLLEQSISLGRRSTVTLFRAGRALSLARKKVPPGENWGDCLKAKDIPRTTAWEAIQLFERAGSEEAIALLSRTEAKEKFGIVKPTKNRTDEERPDLATILFMPKTVEMGADDQCASPTNARPAFLGVVDLDPEEFEYEDDGEAQLEEAMPAKDAESLLAVLTKIVARLERCEQEIPTCILPKQDLDDLCSLIAYGRRILQDLRTALEDSQCQVNS